MPAYSIQFWAFEAREIRSGDGLGFVKTSDTNFCGIGITHAGDPANLAIGMAGTAVTAAVGVSNFVQFVCQPVTLGTTAGDTCGVVWSTLNSGAMQDDTQRGRIMRRSLDFLVGKMGAVPFGPAGGGNDYFADDVNGAWLDLLPNLQNDPATVATDLPTNGCDGYVCGGAITLNGADLAARTAAAPLNIYVLSHGLDSPAGCGTNSLYQSQVVVTKTAD